MNRYKDWTIAEVYWKMESEGSIADLVDWGGPEVFTALGPEAVEAARQIDQAVDLIRAIFEAHTQEIEDFTDD